jgi:hypothetical protein
MSSLSKKQKTLPKFLQDKIMKAKSNDDKKPDMVVQKKNKKFYG